MSLCNKKGAKIQDSTFAAIKLSLEYLKPEMAPGICFPLVARAYSLVRYLLIPLSSNKRGLARKFSLTIVQRPLFSSHPFPCRMSSFFFKVILSLLQA